MCSESEARTIIGVEGAAAIVDVVRGAWQQYLDDGRQRRPSVRASIVWNNMMDLAEVKMATRDDVRIVEHYQTQYFVYQDRLMLALKKLGDDSLPRNVETKVQEKLREAGHLPNMQGVASVACGYELDSTESEIRSIRASRVVKNKLEWSIDMEELASGVLAPASPIFDDVDSTYTRPPLPSIRPTRRKEEGDRDK